MENRAIACLGHISYFSTGSVPFVALDPGFSLVLLFSLVTFISNMSVRDAIIGHFINH